MDRRSGAFERRVLGQHMKFNQALGSGEMLVGDKVTMALDISAVLHAR
jgi:hypothetical protein